MVRYGISIPLRLGITMRVDRTEKDMVFDLLEHYQCHQCGWCCKYHPPQLKDEELTRFRKLTKPNDWLNEDHLKSPCVFLNSDNKCKVQSEKPTICKLYPVMPVVIEQAGYQVVVIVAIDHCPLAREISVDLANFVKHHLKKPWHSPTMKLPKSRANEDLREVVPYNIFATFAKWKSKEV